MTLRFRVRGVWWGPPVPRGMRRPAIPTMVSSAVQRSVLLQRSMVIDGPPGAVSICRHTDIASASRCFAAGPRRCRTHHIAGLGAGDLNAAASLSSIRRRNQLERICPWVVPQWGGAFRLPPSTSRAQVRIMAASRITAMSETGLALLGLVIQSTQLVNGRCAAMPTSSFFI